MASRFTSDELETRLDRACDTLQVSGTARVFVSDFGSRTMARKFLAEAVKQIGLKPSEVTYLIRESVVEVRTRKVDREMTRP